VHYAHQRAIVHHALRPFNILLTTEDVPKITNFGLDRLLEWEPRSRQSGRPATHHLTNYMAPEQTVIPTSSVGPAADVYALGAILYQLLTGRVPPAGDDESDDVAEFLRRVRTEPALPPSHWRADLPRSLDTICLRCLCKVPADRYPSAEALAEALQRFLTPDQPKTEEVELIPGYAVEEELGRGGMGIVHKAREINLDRPVALKVFHAMVPAPILSHVRAANRAMARLNHPNLLHVYGSGERDGLLYIAEELVDGVRLDQKCAGVPQPPREAARLVQTLAQAIDFVHRHGIIHCNLKPRAVLLSPEGVPKITSFEVARLPGGQEPEDAGEITVATPAYMAPEQASGNAGEIGPATDVHALGNILYELLTGRLTVEGVLFGDLLGHLRFQLPEPPRKFQSAIPEDLETICLNCLQKQPAQRYASAAFLAEDLGRFLAGKPLLDVSSRMTPTHHAVRASATSSSEKDRLGSRPSILARLVRWLLARSPIR
jgi:serine/threonine protein kinase